MKRKYWDWAIGLNKIDGLEVSPWMKEFIEKEIKGEYDEENVEYIYHVQIENSDKVIKTTDVWKY